jgi:hypothetical protein
MLKEFAIGKKLSPGQVKKELEAGKVLITKDGKERAVFYKGQYATWGIDGSTRNILMHLTDFSGWYIMKREDRLKREIATKKNTNISWREAMLSPFDKASLMCRHCRPDGHGGYWCVCDGNKCPFPCEDRELPY